SKGRSAAVATESIPTLRSRPVAPTSPQKCSAGARCPLLVSPSSRRADSGGGVRNVDASSPTSTVRARPGPSHEASYTVQYRVGCRCPAPTEKGDRDGYLSRSGERPA